MKSENKMYFIFFNKGDKQYDDFSEILYFKVIKVFFSICKNAFGLFRFWQVNPDWYNQEFLVVSVLLDPALASIWPQWSLDPHMQRMRGYRNLVLNQMPAMNLKLVSVAW